MESTCGQMKAELRSFWVANLVHQTDTGKHNKRALVQCAALVKVG